MPPSAVQARPLPDEVWKSHVADATREWFGFGPFVLKPGQQLLLNDGQPMRIGGRALDILAALVERPGEVVRKRDLMARVWPDIFVEEANLKANMASLRRILGDSPGTPRYIATVVGRGYRFIAEVRFGGSPGVAGAPSASLRLTRRDLQPPLLCGPADPSTGRAPSGR